MRLVKSCIFWIICLLLFFPAGGCVQREDIPVAENRVKEYDAVIILTEKQKNYLLRAARLALKGDANFDFDPLLKTLSGAGAGVEVFAPGEKPVIKIVGGDNFTENFVEALAQVAADQNFISNIKAKLPHARIKVSVIDKVRRLEFDGSARSGTIFRRLGRRVEGGVHGYILALDGKATYQPPDVAVREGWGMNIKEEGEHRKKRVKGRRLARRQIETLSLQASGNAKAWKNGELYAYSTQSFIDSSDRQGIAVDCYRGKTPVGPLTTKSLRDAMTANLDYLLSIQKDDGTLGYIYYPNEDLYDPSYYLPHHAGYVLRLMEAYNKLGDQRYLDAANKALQYLLDRTVTPGKAPQISIVESDGDSMLGVSALMAMIYTVSAQAAPTKENEELCRRFGESLLYFEMPKAGYFYTTFQQALEKREPKKQVRYFPGVAMLAVVRLWEHTGEEKWRDAAMRISTGQEELWRNGGPDAVGLFCWVGMAWARMARIEKDPKMRDTYKNLGYSHADAVITHQWTPERKGFFADYLGAADNSRPPRTTPTSARAESLAENYLTAKYFGDASRQKKYGAALMQALHFVVENQYSDQNSWYLPNAAKARGGVRGGLIANDIRIDYNQHALGAMLNALDVPEDLRKLTRPPQK
jgi:hypothetical protein